MEAKRHPPHISDQQLVGRKRTILGDLFDPRRDAAHLIKAEEYKEKLRAMMEVGDGKIPRVQSSLTPFLRGSGGNGCPFGKKRGLSENEIHGEVAERAQARQDLKAIVPAAAGRSIKVAVKKHIALLALPIEMMHEIFAFLTPVEIKQLRVCRELKSRVNSLRQQLMVRESRIPPAVFKNLIKDSPNLKSLRLWFRDAAVNTQELFNFSSIVHRLQNLRVLDLLGVKKITDGSFQKMMACCNGVSLVSVSLNFQAPLTANALHSISHKAKSLKEFQYAVLGDFFLRCECVYSAKLKGD